MNVLVDHAAKNNVGDISMVESITHKLLRLLPDAVLHVVERPGFASDVISMPRVRSAPMFRRTGSSWRTLPARTSIQRQALSALLGRVLRVQNARHLTDLILFANPSNAGLTPITASTGHARWLREYCEPFDRLHVAGGGYLTDVFPGSLTDKILLIQTFLDQGKHVTLTGQQIGPFESRKFGAILGRTLASLDHFGVRDGESQQRCLELTHGDTACILTGDDSLGLPAADADDVSAALSSVGVVPGRFIAVNLRLSRYSQEVSKHTTVLAAALDRLTRELDMPVIAVPVSRTSGESDVEAARILADTCETTDVKIITDNPGASLTKGIMGAAYGAIGVSFHFCTFALSGGVPAICIHDGAYYGAKASGLTTFWNDDRLAWNLRAAGSEDLAQHCLMTFADPALKPQLEQRARMARATWEDTTDRLILSGHRRTTAITN